MNLGNAVGGWGGFILCMDVGVWLLNWNEVV